MFSIDVMFIYLQYVRRVVYTTKPPTLKYITMQQAPTREDSRAETPLKPQHNYSSLANVSTNQTAGNQTVVNYVKELEESDNTIPPLLTYPFKFLPPEYEPMKYGKTRPYKGLTYCILMYYMYINAKLVVTCP